MYSKQDTPENVVQERRAKLIEKGYDGWMLDNAVELANHAPRFIQGLSGSPSVGAALYYIQRDYIGFTKAEVASHIGCSKEKLDNQHGILMSRMGRRRMAGYALE